MNTRHECISSVCGVSDPREDQFAKSETEKKERIAKNEFQRLRNIARSKKGGLKGS